MFDTSLKGSLFGTGGQGAETAEAPLITMLIECPAWDDIDGVINLGDGGIITDTSPVPAPSTDNSGLPPAVVVDDPEIGALTLLPVELLPGTANADVLIGGAMNDVIEGFGGDDVLRGKAGDDLILGGAGADRILGNSGRDNIFGNSGDDTIRAGVGDDFARGGKGADLINGGRGDDLLFGGAGDDTLIGRSGDDTLKGNAGADVFQFRASDRNDTIMDFQQGQDRVEILNGAGSFADLAIEQDGANVLIGFGTAQITVISDDAGAFDASDFIF